MEEQVLWIDGVGDCSDGAVSSSGPSRLGKGEFQRL